jgi:hypothetical protein
MYLYQVGKRVVGFPVIHRESTQGVLEDWGFLFVSVGILCVCERERYIGC